MLIYMLGHRPYEFGILPDAEGFVTYKELLQSLHEEAGWGYVRQGNINEVLMGEDRLFYESDAGKIRVIDRRWTFNDPGKIQLPSKILYTGIRRKAHPVIMDKGLRIIEGSYYILSPDRNMAERIGRRHDPQPVLLEIMADAAQREGLLLHSFGDLFLTREIPVRFLAGPPVPKSVIKAKEEKAAKSREAKKQEMVSQFQAGAFVLDAAKDPDKHRRDKGRKKRSWKEDARKERKRMRTIPW